jgi:hypothetical protein
MAGNTAHLRGMAEKEWKGKSSMQGRVTCYADCPGVL